ncbi:MAG TPA: hypothetical protein VG889_20625 [Rhizomicrobium sp.]|nr:hypothetical protein [Rhizomicrobium sp.]
MDSGWAAVVGSIVGGIGTFSATWLSAHLNRARPDPSTEAAKQLLKKMLQSRGFEWRTIVTMSNVVGLPEAETRKLLLEIGARGAENDPELWGLISRNPLKEMDASKAADGPYDHKY